jgi:hypothetical protein
MDGAELEPPPPHAVRASTATVKGTNGARNFMRASSAKCIAENMNGFMREV